MMGTMLDRLAAEEILPAKTVSDLREYISRKNPPLSLASKAAVFADAVNRILRDKIPEMPEDRLKQFKVSLFRETSAKDRFCIDGSDVLKSALRLRVSDEPFIDGLGDWLEKTLGTPVDRDKVTLLVTNACVMMDESADTALDELIELAEKKTGGIEAIGDKAVENRMVGGKAIGDGIAGGKAADGEMAGEKAADSEALDGGTVSASGVIPFISPNPDQGLEIDTKEADQMTETSALRLLLTRSLPARRKQLRAIAAVGLIGISVLLSYFSARYINATENTGLPQGGSLAIIEQEELPAGAVVPADPKDEGDNTLKMTATAYDLSFESCGKEPSHPAYGVTSSGTKATVGRTIAVDPDVIPLGSRVKITFPEKYSYLDGIYIAEDTGRLIKGNRVDVYFGEDKVGSKTVNKLAMDFGVQNVKVEVLE